MEQGIQTQKKKKGFPGTVGFSRLGLPDIDQYRIAKSFWYCNRCTVKVSAERQVEQYVNVYIVPYSTTSCTPLPFTTRSPIGSFCHRSQIRGSPIDLLREGQQRSPNSSSRSSYSGSVQDEKFQQQHPQNQRSMCTDIEYFSTSDSLCTLVLMNLKRTSPLEGTRAKDCLLGSPFGRYCRPLRVCSGVDVKLTDVEISALPCVESENYIRAPSLAQDLLGGFGAIEHMLHGRLTCLS